MHQNLIRRGDESLNVVRLQEFLKKNYKNEIVNVTGIFGPDTEKLVRHYQGTMKLMADGIVGKNTLAFMKLDLTPTVLTDLDYELAAKNLGVEVALIRAVADVESRSEAFWKDQGNKTPILFERHIFDRLLARPWKNDQALAAIAGKRLDIRKQYPDICNPAPGGYGNYKDQYPKLIKACSISDTIGLMSASWGTFQIMGFNYEAMKYNSVQAFVRAMQASQGDHLKAFIRFIQSNVKMLVNLKRKNWTEFAKIYNGPQQKGYDSGLEAAYQKYK